MFAEAGARTWGSHLLVRACVSRLEHHFCHLPEGSWGTSVPTPAFESRRTSFSPSYRTRFTCLETGQPGSVALKTGCPVVYVSEVKWQGRLRAALPRVTSAILACVFLAASGCLLGTVASSQCKALGREGRGAELPSLRLCAPRSLK